MLEISGEWPIGEDAEDAVFSVSLALRKRGESPRLFGPTGEGERPGLLECAGAVLCDFVCQATEDGWIARTDIGRPLASGAPWPRWCLSREQVAPLFSSLIPGPLTSADETEIYPISIWLVPPENRAQAESAVDLFRSLPRDGAVFRNTLEKGMIRAAVFHGFCDIMADRKQGAKALHWMRGAANRATEIEIKWSVGPL